MPYKLAIVIPSWNCSEHIGEMLDSILANTFADWRCFVVDDKSTDGCTNVIQDYVAKDKRIVLKVRDREPKGAPTCRNIGLDLSEGAEYVIWFDADDVIAPYCFEQRVAYMDRHQELDFASFPAKGFRQELWEECSNTYGIRYGEDSLRDMLKWCLPMVGWTNIYRRTALLRFHQRWDESIRSMQDSDFNISAMIKGMAFDFAWDEGACTDYFYRMGQPGGKTIASKIFSKEHLNSHLYLLDKIFSSLSELQKQEYREEIECYIFKFANLFRKNTRMYFRMLQLPYLKDNSHLRHQLYSFYLFTKIFPFKQMARKYDHLPMIQNIKNRWEEKQTEWSAFMTANSIKMIQRHSETL